MFRSIENRLDILFKHYISVCIFLTLFMTSLVGVGDVRIVSMAGFMLCIIGFIQNSAKADLWIFIPLILYNIISMFSSYATYGNFTDGYGSTQFIFTIIYLLMACCSDHELLFLKRLCALWTAAAAAIGVTYFVGNAVFQGKAARLEGVLGNPNAMGIFLVIGWFMLMHCMQEDPAEDKKTDFWSRVLPHLEPVLFFALALTLSMGSFAAMAVGIIMLLISKRKLGIREVFHYACQILAKAALGIGTGILIYLGAARTDTEWICAPLFLYAAAAVLCWKDFEHFLETHKKISAVISALGILVAAAAIAIRPSAIETFIERLEMMKSCLHYLAAEPLFGVGPYQWRLLDLEDGGKYFNTWHIHNALLHIGVELGCITMGLILMIVIRFYKKKPDAYTKAGFTAYFVHNMIDTSFFYTGITALTVIMAGNPRKGGKEIGSIGLKILFGLFAVINIIHLIHSFRTM